jgi:hypothetical protein
MTHEVRERIRRPATTEEKARHDKIRAEVAEEKPDLTAWARAAAATHKDRISVGADFTAEEAQIVEVIDAYARTHSLPNRGAVVRQALANLLGIQLDQP